MITKCKALWLQAFGDTEEMVDLFFRTAYDPAHSHQILENNVPVSALYWLDYFRGKERFAYIYAVATEKAFRGRGYFHKLMTRTHEILKKQGYAGSIVVPAEPGLVRLYERLGYQCFYSAKVREIAAEGYIPAEKVSWEAYAAARKCRIPGQLQPGKALYAYLSGFGEFYQTENSIFALSKQGDTLYFQEFLGESRELPGITASLQAKKAIVRFPEENTPFALFCPFTDVEKPDYFALPLD